MNAITKYWLKNIKATGTLCSLCGNWGFIDTRGVRSPAGIECGAINYCICPNGQLMRKKAVPVPTKEK